MISSCKVSKVESFNPKPNLFIQIFKRESTFTQNKVSNKLNNFNYNTFNCRASYLSGGLMEETFE